MTEEQERRLRRLAEQYRAARLDAELMSTHPGAYQERCIEAADALCAEVTSSDT